MPRKTLLFLNAEHCQACIWQNGQLSAAKYFSSNAEGRKQFAAFLQAHRDPAYLLTDLVEEDFRHEIVPHLRGGERAALMRRKLEQYYRNTPFRQALTLQRRKEGRRDDDVLFSALTNPGIISPWPDMMLSHGIPLAGIYSIPHISAPLIKDISSDHLLLLSWEKHVGLRQTYFDAGLLRFSRLTPINNSSFSEVVATEAARTQQYLKSLSLLPAGQMLDAYIICHAHDRQELEARLGDSADIRYACLDIQELGRRIKSRMDFADSDATSLFLHLLAAKPPYSHYAAAEHSHVFRLAQARRILLGLNAALASAGLLWSAANILEGNRLSAESESLKIQAGKLSYQTQQITQGFSGTSASATDMKNAVLLVRKLNNYAPPPQAILDGLGKTLDDFPRIRMDKLAWQANAAPDTVSPNGIAANAPAQVITLSGELTEFPTKDYRSMLDYLEHFRQALSRHGYGVTALGLPLDISPQGSIAAGLGEDAAKPAQFSLKLIWRSAA